MSRLQLGWQRCYISHYDLDGMQVSHCGGKSLSKDPKSASCFRTISLITSNMFAASCRIWPMASAWRSACALDSSTAAVVLGAVAASVLAPALSALTTAGALGAGGSALEEAFAGAPFLASWTPCDEPSPTTSTLFGHFFKNVTTSVSPACCKLNGTFHRALNSSSNSLSRSGPLGGLSFARFCSSLTMPCTSILPSSKLSSAPFFFSPAPSLTAGDLAFSAAAVDAVAEPVTSGSRGGVALALACLSFNRSRYVASASSKASLVRLGVAISTTICPPSFPGATDRMCGIRFSVPTKPCSPTTKNFPIGHSNPKCLRYCSLS
mmetsp:Transcript_51413/g.95087  ORF Transcript_51413/g.95087 Transcript_51413/m.95087 type:complete len:322 (-) Transcript_51413:1194-2159(-)